MTEQKMPRVMWLLNHDSARKFEVAMLKRIGVREIFLPKKYPDDPTFRSASVDHAEDAGLSIPAADLAVLNAADWYGTPGRAAWEIANRHFDVLFFIVHQASIVKEIARHFHGVALWRTYGRFGEGSYFNTLQGISGNLGEESLRALGKRLFFAEAYPHLHAAEPDLLQARRLHLPLGLADSTMSDQWQGGDPRILFVCPDIALNAYYKAVYQDFLENFKGLPYAIAGAQPIPVDDPHVLGFVPRQTHEQNMRDMRVMFYHSREPNHVHYHPFEAVRAGMPLVFMGGGMLDRLGGKNLSGRCADIGQARSKITRILQGDQHLIESIRTSQGALLEPMQAANCIDAWQQGFQTILGQIESIKRQPARPGKQKRKPRIAVILPTEYRGGSLRGAMLLARAIHEGSRQAGQDAEIVFGHLDNPACYPDELFAEMPAYIKRRPFRWRTLPYDEARRAAAYAGLTRPLPPITHAIPDDGIRQFMDCDLWVIISDRLLLPLLPVRPYALMVYDYLQRYEPTLDHADNQSFLLAAHAAERVFVTTEFTRQDALQFAGIPAERLIKLPMLAPSMTQPALSPGNKPAAGYFLWTTNMGPHKNHENAFKALRRYYEEHDGQLACHITGVGTGRMTASEFSPFNPVREMVATNPELEDCIKVFGELPDPAYHAMLANSAYLWHAGRIDNGTFSVIEAARLGVPSLSSDYPSMREIAAQFQLDLNWMDPHDPAAMARQLKAMETACLAGQLAATAAPAPSQSLENLAPAYWAAIRECL